MSSFFILRSLVFVAVLVTFVTSQPGLIGPGIWVVINSRGCRESDNLASQVSIRYRKYNRTQGVFDVQWHIEEDITDTDDVEFIVCRYTDGGCKPTYIIIEKYCDYMTAFWGKNWNNIMSGFGVHPPECPIPKGDYQLESFIFDLELLPLVGIYGSFEARFLISQRNVTVSCTEFTLDFNKKEIGEVTAQDIENSAALATHLIPVV